MTNSNNDIEELEELLTELEGQEARIVTPYSEEDDAVTRLMDAPLGDQDWMVQVTALDRRMMSTSQLMSELQSGKVNGRTLVWRTGMDDWMPVSRIDELSRGSASPSRVTASPVGMPTTRNSSPRAGFANLAPPPPPPQPSQPMWSNPPSAPLPPPPSAMSPPFGMAPGAGLPPPPLALQPPPPPPPMALTPAPSGSFGVPKPLPVSAPPPDSMSHGNTTRPVAVDFSDMMPENDAPLQSKRWVMALSAVAILAVFVTVYSLSSGGGESETKEKATAAAAKPQAMSALQPTPSASAKEKPVQSAAAMPAPKAASDSESPATAKATDDDEQESDSSASASARQTAQARYSPRSEYRRRSRGGSSSDDNSRSSDAEEAPAPAPAAPSVAAAATAPASTARGRGEEEAEAPSEPVAAVADEVDEPPKSTGKSSGNTFNREAAKAALDEAAEQAKNCRPQGGPSGTGRVQVRYEPSGKVSNVAILSTKFDNTTTGSCVRMLFRRAKVPEFTGAPVVVVNKSFEIP